jgi:hypothetical protein
MLRVITNLRAFMTMVDGIFYGSSDWKSTRQPYTAAIPTAGSMLVYIDVTSTVNNLALGEREPISFNEVTAY